MTTLIRGYRPVVLAAIYEICLLVGDNGEDATPLYRQRSILGDLYAGAYGLSFKPEFAFVAEDPEGASVDSRSAFPDARPLSKKRLEQEWWPALRQRYRDPARHPGRKKRNADERAASLIHHPPARVQTDILAALPLASPYPMCCRGSRASGPRRAIDAVPFCDALGQAGSTGVHLCRQCTGQSARHRLLSSSGISFAVGRPDVVDARQAAVTLQKADRGIRSCMARKRTKFLRRAGVQPASATADEAREQQILDQPGLPAERFAPERGLDAPQAGPDIGGPIPTGVIVIGEVEGVPLRPRQRPAPTNHGTGRCRDNSACPASGSRRSRPGRGRARSPAWSRQRGRTAPHRCRRLGRLPPRHRSCGRGPCR